jgi:hypothetical protein
MLTEPRKGTIASLFGDTPRVADIIPSSGATHVPIPVPHLYNTSTQTAISSGTTLSSYIFCIVLFFASRGHPDVHPRLVGLATA